MLWIIAGALILFWIIAAIVEQIKAPAEAEARLINLKEEKAKYEKLCEEAEAAKKEFEKAKNDLLQKESEARSQLHSAQAEANRYIALRENLVSRYNRAKSELDTNAHRQALEMLSYSNDFLSAFAPQCDIAELHQSIMEGKLLKAFEYTPEITNVKIQALVKSPNDIYTTTLTNCTCKDFHFRNHPCKHMLYLYYTLGMLKIDQPLQEEATRILNITLSDVSKNKDFIKKLNTVKRNLEDDIKELKKKKISVSEEIDNFNDILRNRHLRFPQVAEIVSLHITEHYDYAAHRLIFKSNPAYKASDVVKDLSKETKEYVRELAKLRLKLAYIEDMYPNINDIFESGFNDEDNFELETKDNTDRVRFFLSPEEYRNLSTTEKNQLALDRYVESRKSKWQIGRDYEMYIGHKLEVEGYAVKYTGIIENLEDMGRDLIALKGDKTLIVQCKNWSQEKTIHEKHVFQLYGTLVLYKLDNPIFDAKGVFVTTTKLSDKARAVANELDIEVIENLPLGDFPRIKCNVNRTTGERIYHLPFDQQYDNTVINEKDGEFYAFTVKEAEDKGFRRAWKHYQQ